MSFWLIIFSFLQAYASGNPHPNDIDIVTCNLGLYSGIAPNVDSRCTKQVKILKASLKEQKIICLQGVVFQQHVKEIVDSFGNTLPYSASFLHQNIDGYHSFNMRKDRPCNHDDEKKLEHMADCYDSVDCMHPQSIKKDNNEFIKCAMQFPKCSKVLLSLSQSCLTCVVLETTQPHWYHQTCLSEDNAMNPTGLMLLSSRPIKKVTKEILNKDGTKRTEQSGYIMAEIEGLDNTVCTKWASSMGKIEKDVNGKTFETENKDDASELIKRTAKLSKTTFVLGDLGFSVEHDNVLERYPETSKYVEEVGLRNASPHSICLECFGNSLVQGDGKPGYSGYCPQMIMFKKKNPFDSEDADHKPYVTRETGSNIYFKQSSEPLSHHYCVRMTAATHGQANKAENDEDDDHHH